MSYPHRSGQLQRPRPLRPLGAPHEGFLRQHGLPAHRPARFARPRLDYLMIVAQA